MIDIYKDIAKCYDLRSNSKESHHENKLIIKPTKVERKLEEGVYNV